MKLDKNLFKSVVKECLIEILAEGLVTETSGRSKRSKARLSEALDRKASNATSLERMGSYSQTNNPQSARKRHSYLDNIKFSDGKQQRTNNIAENITQDPVMRDILADTAQTTLREQVSAESTRRPMTTSAPADKAAAIVEQSDPSDLFGESSKNWATLAFS